MRPQCKLQDIMMDSSHGSDTVVRLPTGGNAHLLRTCVTGEPLEGLGKPEKLKSLNN